MKKITISLDDNVYYGLLTHVGRSNINQFLNNLAKFHLRSVALENGYHAMAKDFERETNAFTWGENTLDFNP